jgi:hypothetical protein
VFELIGEAATGIGAALRGKEHPQGKPKGPSGECPPEPRAL